MAFSLCLTRSSIYPFIFLTMPKLWNVANKKGYITGADFMLRSAMRTSGSNSRSPSPASSRRCPISRCNSLAWKRSSRPSASRAKGILAHLPLTIAFMILAVYTYTSGLRAPAMIAFVKDIMIYIFVIAAVIIIPAKLGGYGAVFAAAAKDFEGKPTGILLTPAQYTPVHNAGDRLGDGALHVSAFDDGRARRFRPEGASPQCHGSPMPIRSCSASLH